MSPASQTYKAPSYVYFIWLTLLGAMVISAFRGAWMEVFLSLFTLGLSIYIVRFCNAIEFNVPPSLLTASIVFIYATLFLGEVGNFYENFWWWDLVLHSGSAIGFGLVGVITLILMFRQNKLTASPFLITVFGFAFALAIGALWEIFEFSMDQLFGLSMQKSGLMDTMSDLIVDSFGALLASVAGYLYLKKKVKIGLSGVIHEAVKIN